MDVRVVPGQQFYRWCSRCRAWSALEVGVFTGPRTDGLIGTFTACERCDPDLFRPEGGDDARPH